MAGRTGSRVVASRVFPRGVYTAAADRPSGTAECQENLQHSLPGSGRDPTNDCGRPPTSGGGNRLLSRQGAERLFPQEVPDSFAKGLPERQAPVPRRTGPVGPTGGLRGAVSEGR